MPSLAPDPVADLVAADRAERDQRQQRADIQDMRRGENARGDQQGIAGKKEAEEKAGLHKNDDADQKRPAPLDQALDVVDECAGVVGWNRA